MTSHTSSETVWILFDALNTRDVERAVNLIDPSYRGRDVTRSSLTIGREKARKEIRAGMNAFSDLTFSIRKSVADPPHVSIHWTLDAVHDGPFLHVPATHQPVSVAGAGFFTVRDRRIVRAVHLWNLSGFLRTCGLLPDLPGEDGPGFHGADDDPFG